jgi:UDP-3-O-[3-hydroxymyristoyl] glucosamine N-acyltransferase
MARTIEDVLSALADLSFQVTGQDRTFDIVAPCPLNKAIVGGLTFLRDAGRASLLADLPTPILVLVPIDLEPDDVPAGVLAIHVDNPRFAFARLVGQVFAVSKPKAGVHVSAVVDASATIHPTASIGANVVIGAGSSIGAESVIHANAVVGDSVQIGRNVVIHSGTVVGADGFGYERGDDGVFEKFPHIGGVVIEDDVEIGSNTSIDRGALQDTVIGRGSKIDNQVHISHNVQIGQHTAVIAQSMIGGSVVIGDFAWVAPSACVMNQRKIGSRATIGLQALVVKDVAIDTTVMGSPAVTQADFRVQRKRMDDVFARLGIGD